MSEFFLLNTIDIFDDKKYAYTEPIEIVTGEVGPICPKCGAPVGWLDWIEPRRVKLSKPKYGDFVYGLRMLVSENFKNAYEKSKLKGIKEFLPVNVMKVNYLGKKPFPQTRYYSISLMYSLAKVDLNKSKITGQVRERHCDLCMPKRTTIDEVDGLYIDDSNWKGEDIFHLYEMGSTIFVSQKFVDFCLENKFGNFKCINTKDYKTLFDKGFTPTDKAKIVGNPPF